MDPAVSPPPAPAPAPRPTVTRIGAIAVLAAGVVTAVVLAPRLSLSGIEDWAARLGWAFPVVFIAVQVLVTTAPVPRTLFTLAAGVLFPPLTGVAIALLATTITAVAVYLAVRRLGREAVAARLTHPTAQVIEQRLERRGWLAVGSLRMIGFIPFSLVNYCAGLSAVRLVPYTAATVLGSLPGTVAVVFLGQALTGGLDPVMLVISAAGLLLGVVGLWADGRWGGPLPPRPERRIR